MVYSYLIMSFICSTHFHLADTIRKIQFVQNVSKIHLATPKI